MYEIGSGIRVYFENKKEFRNVVFFPDNTYTYYPTGGMLFELIRDDAIYMVTTKVENMIKAFPDYNAEASKESVTNGFKWLYGTIEDEELPVATELFRGCFNEAILDVAGRPGSYECVGDFFVKCYEEYLSHIEAFSVYVDAIAAYNSGIADFLPLTTNASIIENNALRIDWEDLVPKSKLSYIIGNPPFSGARQMREDSEQKKDIQFIFEGWKNAGNLDYVCCWYKKSTEYMQGTTIRAALVSTNSISQGESVSNLWKPLFDAGLHIDFAYRTFRWDSEASKKAHVHCVIIGFSLTPYLKPKIIFAGDTKLVASNINGYLLDGDNFFVQSRNKPLCHVSEIGIGNQPIDDGNYLFEKDEMLEFIKTEPTSISYFHP